MPTPLLELRGAGLEYGRLPALADIDLRVEAGERLALVGPSGAGKSSLLALAGGRLLPTRGRVLLLGEDTAAMSPRALGRLQRRVGTVHQQFDLVGQIRVLHNVNAGHLGRWPTWKALLSLLSPREIDLARSVLERVGIPDKLWARTEQLSAGQQQRVAIARVLVQDPDLILADEPTASLDPERARDIMQLLEDLCRETGKTLVASLHTVEQARRHFDRVVGLREGRMVFDAPAYALDSAMLDALYRIDGSAKGAGEGLRPSSPVEVVGLAASAPERLSPEVKGRQPGSGGIP